MQAKDIEAVAGDVRPGEDAPTGFKEAIQGRDDQQSSPHAAPSVQDEQWTSPSPLDRLVAYGRHSRLSVLAQDKFEQWHLRDKVLRFSRLCGLTLMLILVVMLASVIMAFWTWFTIVVGHVILYLAVPESVDPMCKNAMFEYTMAFAAIGAFIVNLPPFVVFLLSFPLTFDRAVLESSRAPANDFIKRIMPKNRYALLFIQYAPRLLAGPIGCRILEILTADYTQPDFVVFDPLHAFLAGLAGEVVLSGLGRLKDLLTRKRVGQGPSVIITKGSLPI